MLCDLQMPEMSGMEFYGLVREQFPALADRFMFVTGGAFSSDARRFLEESVAAVIQKPFRVEDLLVLIDRIAAGGCSGGSARRSTTSGIPVRRAT